MSAMTILDETDTILFVGGDWSAPLDLDERFRAECDLRDWRNADRRYQERVEAGEALDEEECADWAWCMDRIIAALLADRGL